MNPESWQQDLIKLIGDENFFWGESLPEKNSYSLGLKDAIAPEAVLRIRHKSDLPKVFALAKTHGFSVHPVSQGKNWGYGDGSATDKRQWLLDLSALSKIKDYDPALGVVTVEAGVSQGQLAEFLKTQGHGWRVDITGAGPETSLVGNILERGFGHSRYGQRYLYCSNMEICLANGRFLRTGFGAFQESQSAALYEAGLGPSISGLLFQSNFAVVTELSLWLHPKAEEEVYFFVSAERSEQGPLLLERLSQLKREGLLPSNVHFANGLRSLMSYRQRSLEGPDPVALSRQLEEVGLKAWSACGSYAASPEMCRAFKKTLKRRLHPFKVKFLKPKMLRYLQQIESWLPWRPRFFSMLPALESALKIMGGEPCLRPLRALAWASADSNAKVQSFSKPEAVAKFANGLMWLCPVLPAVSKEAFRALTRLEEIAARHGFELPITLTLANEKSIFCVSNISFNRDCMKERQAARQCYSEALEFLLTSGFLPYRISSEAREQVQTHLDPAYQELLLRLKTAFDPDALVSPSRLIAKASSERMAQRVKELTSEL